ncbi:maleylacetoacetate isomerase [Duganella sp. Leaf126]|uniref:maleylacetoacetate isomerase n=1 Tax=Duganella sp. Leaf126 TaxID=1736266 RepID=UPI0006F2D602|nr:maleylacetoacetate isomerase [Duganella sp. Leaf126]KQQ31906.1 maleylacetoacetate isomerase [Duganella sp. Leaf126]
MKLYTYFRSSAAYRVRIALALKGIAYEAVPVHLLRDGGEQLGDNYRAVNPSALLPTLEDDNGVVIGQSLAILEYLEETRPTPPLLPPDAAGRARVRALALTLVADSHPLSNLRVLKYVKGELGQGEDAKLAWQRHWLHEGLATFEALLTRDAGTGRYCHGATPTLADCCLVPQLFNARRFGLDLTGFPTLVRIDAACAELPAFQAAQPARQPDAE